MTATPAVVHFLMKHDCLNILATLIQSSSNPRLLEILVGIVGNMCCVREARTVVSEDTQLHSMLLQLPTLNATYEMLTGDPSGHCGQHVLCAEARTVVSEDTQLHSMLLQLLVNDQVYKEILVGIVGNMCCVREARTVVSEDTQLHGMLLQLLTCPDPQTLIQLSRCLQSFTWDLLRGDATLVADQHWLERQVVSGHLCSSLAFILSSSLNDIFLSFLVVDQLLVPFRCRKDVKPNYEFLWEDFASQHVMPCGAE
ncbi:hypothetical protein J6590_064740 [Homalodisca vitripennis]|nr:hypothetical protein J6590_064740 [Homalodisca vitripennis]